MIIIQEIAGKLRDAWRDAFSSPAAPADDPPAFVPTNPAERPLVNYLWINKDKSVPHPKKLKCVIPLAYVQRAVDNANKYPEAEVQIWVDKKILDDYSQFCLQSFIDEKSTRKNVTVCDLQDIPDYAKDPYFVPLEPTEKGYLNNAFSRSCPRNVYSRADYARILVLDHCLQTQKERQHIIYSDMDCKDLRLPEAKRVMNKHGIAIHDFGGGQPSHGYIGIRANDEIIKEHFPALKNLASSFAHEDALGSKAFAAFLEFIGKPNKRCHEIIGLPDLLPPIGAAPRPINYTPPSDKFTTWKVTYAPY